MNKKYMDFVPVNVPKKVAKKQPEAVVEAPKPVIRAEGPVQKVVRPVAMPKPTRKTPATGESKSVPATEKRSLNELDKKTTMNLPKPTFVNTEKVSKRPLSKNVYQKKVETPVEEPKAPVKIIDKPEKDSKVGLIVTIIITIILGAAAGTVAFLLLPK